jgi:hypothetical protein
MPCIINTSAYMAFSSHTCTNTDENLHTADHENNQHSLFQARSHLHFFVYRTLKCKLHDVQKAISRQRSGRTDGNLTDRKDSRLALCQARATVSFKSAEYGRYSDTTTTKCSTILYILQNRKRRIQQAVLYLTR